MRNRVVIVFCCLALSCGLLSPSSATLKEYHVGVWGQSNALGCAQGLTEDIPTLSVWDGHQWLMKIQEPYPIGPESYRDYCRVGAWGAMARALAPSSMWLSGYAVPGTTVQQWSDASENWKTFIATVDATHPTVLIVWIGELNAALGMVDDFDVVLEDRIRASAIPRVIILGNPDAPLVSIEATSRVNQKKRQLVDRLSQRATYIETTGLPLQDQWHLTSDSYQEVGVKIANLLKFE